MPQAGFFSYNALIAHMMEYQISQELSHAIENVIKVTRKGTVSALEGRGMTYKNKENDEKKEMRRTATKGSLEGRK